MRIYAGVLWLLYGTSKLPGWLFSSTELVKTTRDMIKTTGGPYHDFVVSVVVPHAQIFSGLIATGETLCGISLLLGLFGKLGGLGGHVPDVELLDDGRTICQLLGPDKP